MQGSSVQFSAVQFSAVKCSAVKCSPVQCIFTEVDEDCCSFINKLFVDFYAANWYSAVECSAVG